MRKNLLLVGAFLAVASSAMAITADDLGKLYYETYDGMKAISKKVPDLKVEESKKEEAKFEFDRPVMLKAIDLINPTSYVSESMFTAKADLRGVGTDTAEITKLVFNEKAIENYKDILTTADSELKKYNDFKKVYDEALKNAKSKDDEKVKVAKLNLADAERAYKANIENAKEIRNAVNKVLAIAGTDLDSYIALDEAKKEAEKKKIAEKLSKWNAEADYFEEVANTYVYGDAGDLEAAPDQPAAGGTAAQPDAEAKRLKENIEITNYKFSAAALRITENAMNIENNRKAIMQNAQDIKDLRKDHNRGMAQMAAMSSIDFGTVKTRSVKIGAGIGHHASETGVAVGVAVAPTETLSVNARWATSANSIKKSTIGLGATYEFNF